MFLTKQVEQSLPSQMEQTGGASPIGRLSVSRVEPKDLLSVWGRLLPQIRRGLKRGMGDTMSERRLFSQVAHGDVDLWALHRGSDVFAGIFLQTVERERGKALIILNVVGSGFRENAEEMLKRFREYADMIGAYTIESYSRLGAARHLMRLGCKPKAIVMELRNGRLG